MSLFPIIISLFLLVSATALQVTPNSPCAQFCFDSSNTNSSETRGDEIVCNDDDFKRKAEGQKFQRCLACLQDSTFKQGNESDQDWFLYNMRYSFDYCIFGYPNATDIPSGPCITSEACGPIGNALKKGITEPDDREQYGYCDTDDKAMLGDAVAKCQACVKADSTHTIISNFLVALDAGCQQRPKPGTPIGLNDTVFSERTISILDPSASVVPGDSHDLPNTSIAAIAVGAFAFLLISAGCIFMQHRKRSKNSAHNRRSSLSFRCQTRLTPMTPGFHDLPPYMDEERNLSKPSFWSHRNAMRGSLDTHKLGIVTTTIPHPPPTRAIVHTPNREDSSPTESISSCSNAPLLSNSAGPQCGTPGIASPLFSPGLSITTPRSATFPRECHDSNNPWVQQQNNSSKGFLKKKKSRDSQAPSETRNIKIVFDPPPKRAR
ncbi:related to exo-alpha-sialidase / neuraminidase [Fusarium torulosum]|uniref:Related to exo-alpha-sialidase / neuraminidase n=1 Tax=Fusarium torulosum TaxID=33205 RepID=A0AAE8SM23_9HYPO|nr:related to exo-alpha-sialidase / neuraminidase [Fusarium torulosum]